MAIKDGIAIGTSLPPPALPRAEDWRFGYRLIRDTIVGILQGRTNNVGELTIDVGDSPLTIIDERCAESSVILVMPVSEDLAVNFTWWISAVDNGSFVFEFTYGGQFTPTAIRYAIIG